MQSLGKIAVAGATGRVGHHVVDVLEVRGHDVVPMSRSRGVDVISGDGLAAALADVECVIDALAGPSPEQDAATTFFTTAARNLQEAGQRAGVQRVIVVSIIGVDRFTAGYGAAKIAHEQAMLSGPIPVRVLRAAQFHELVGQLVEWGTRGDVSYVPMMRTQLVAARTVAEALADLATAPETGGPPFSEIAGPREESLVEMAMLLASRRGHPSKIEGVSDPADPDHELTENGALLPARAPSSPAPRSGSGWTRRPDRPPRCANRSERQRERKPLMDGLKVPYKVNAEDGAGVSEEREKVRFVSGGTQCAAWHYPGTNGACVIMAGGFAVTKEPGTDPFAKRFHDAGFAVLAFDYRRIGESGGQPRQVLPVRDQLADWQAAIAFAATLPGVDPTRLAVWGFSLSGGHVFRVAARNPQLAAAIAQTPNADGLAASRNASRHQTPLALLRLTGRGLLDALGGLVARQPLLVPLAGEPGSVSLLTTPDGRHGDRALNPDNRYPDWQQAAAARSALRIGFYQPGRYASRVRCPLLVLVCDQDRSALAGPAVRAAKRAPRAQLFRMPGGHYEPFLNGHEQAVEAELSFLRRHLLEPSHADRPVPVATDTGLS